MRRLGIGVAATLVGAAVLAPPGCQPLQVAHSIENTRFELRGKHFTAACESCHGDLGAGCLGSGKPKPQPTSCIACHSGELPLTDHPEDDRECSACHVEDGWNVGFTTTDSGTSPPTDTGTVPVEDTGFEHFPVAPETSCAEGGCHETDRPLDHWVDLPRIGDWWDCGPCHNTEDWTEAIEHPIHTPHGVWDSWTATSPTLWIFACEPCHTTGPPYSSFQCMEPCHESVRFDPLEEDHNSFVGGDEHQCIACHTYGDFQ